MSTAGKRAYDFLEKLSFVRIAGSDEEKRAAKMIQDEIKAMGLESRVEEFDTIYYEPQKVEFKVCEPYEKTYEVTMVGRSGSTPEEGLEAEFIYVSEPDLIQHMGVKGKVVMLDTHVSYETYRDLIKYGAVGYITFSGNFHDDKDRTDIAVRVLRHGHTKNGECPGVTLRVSDAMEMVQKKASKVKLTVVQDYSDAISQNVICELKGEIDEDIIFCGHYDSVEYSKGAYDNGAGSVIIMELLRHFKDQKLKRNMKFIWFGAEERGLVGSKAYVDKVKDFEQIKLVVNVDVAGCILGTDMAIVTGDKSLQHMVDYMAKEIGFRFKSRNDIYSSDGSPFSFNGVPSINFMKFSARGGASIHDRYDIFDTMDVESFEATTNFVQMFADKLNSFAHWPISRDIPEDVKKKLKKYMDKNMGKLKDEKEDKK